MQERSRRKRDAVLAAALALFGKHGFEATTIEAIATRAGVAVGGFYGHFASKRQLLLVLMDRLLTDIDAMQSDAAPLPAHARSAVEMLVRHGLQTDWAHAGLYRAWREAVASDTGLARLDERVVTWTAGRTAELLRAAGQLPGARSDVNVDVLATILTELFWKVAETPAAQRSAVADVVVDLIVHAVLHDPPLNERPKPYCRCE